MRRVLIVDNNLHTPCCRCSRFTYGMGGSNVTVVRPLEDGLPRDISKFTHIVLSGSMGHIDDHDKLFKTLRPFIRQVVAAKIPLLGICYGHQAIIGTLASPDKIILAKEPEIGWAWIRRVDQAHSRLLAGLPRHFWAINNHHHEACGIPDGFIVTARSKRCAIAAVEHTELPIFGVQFHPEASPYQLHKAIIAWRRRKVNQDWLTDQATNDRHFNPKLEHKIFRNFYRL